MEKGSGTGNQPFGLELTAERELETGNWGTMGLWNWKQETAIGDRDSGKKAAGKQPRYNP